MLKNLYVLTGKRKCCVSTLKPWHTEKTTIFTDSFERHILLTNLLQLRYFINWYHLSISFCFFMQLLDDPTCISYIVFQNAASFWDYLMIMCMLSVRTPGYPYVLNDEVVPTASRVEELTSVGNHFQSNIPNVDNKRLRREVKNKFKVISSGDWTWGHYEAYPTRVVCSTQNPFRA